MHPFIKRTLAMIKFNSATSALVRRFDRAKELSDLENTLKLCDKLIELGEYAIGSLVGIRFLDQSKNWYDPITAKRYLEPAAEAGETNAQWHLGMIYYLGLDGSALDPVMGYYWVKKAANAGNTFALKFLEERDNGFLA